MLELLDAFEWIAYVVGFWLFFLDPSFRRRMLGKWRAREGLQHVHTVFEIGIATACAVITVWAIAVPSRH